MTRWLPLIFAIFFASPALAQPNIVFIFADDMGYADLACYGAKDVKTPNIDKLAADGVRFINAYAMGPECTPSRTSILTGRYPQRVGGLECAIGTGNVGRYDDAIRLCDQHDLGLPSDLAVLAPSLKQAGYTNGVFGKWHLGYEPKFSPLEQGFDEFVGFLGGNVEYFDHYELSDIDVYLSGMKPIEREGYLTDLITEDAVSFIQARGKNPDKPFFLYLPHGAPHFPFQAPGDGDKPKPTKETWKEGTRENYAAMIDRLDESVGSVIAALEKQGLAENTIVVFASDHGAIKPGDNSPWRDFKSTLFEGGIRVPLIARWPGKIKPGTESEQVATLMDLTTSFLNAAGASHDDLDGEDILAHVAEGKDDHERILNWRSRRGDRTWWAVRDGTHKYVRRKDGDKTEEWFFDLVIDPVEDTNLLERELTPVQETILADLKKTNNTWQQEVAPTR